METLSISLGFSIWRSEADFGRRMAGSRMWLVAGRGGCDQRGLLTTGTKARASLRSPRLLCLSLPLQASLSVRTAHKKTPSGCLGLLVDGGPKRIRTAVAAFAELSLATRPSDQSSRRLAPGLQIYENERGRLHPTRAKCTFAP